MATLTATVDRAAHWAAETTTPARDWNPVYRALVPGPAPTGEPAPADGSDELVRHQFTARALLVVAVTHEESTRRARVALDPAGATVEASIDGGASQWSTVPIDQVPRLITELLDAAGVDPEAPRLTVERTEHALRPTPAQIELLRDALARGESPQDAFASVPDLDDRLRDALTTSGPRVSVSLTLHDPGGRVTEAPVSWSRLWVRGDRDLYRMDAAESSIGAIHPVAPGDVLGTVLPVLEEGLRFEAACAARGGAR
ncbi:hypothetical protein ACFQS2_09765 [Brachybacterium sp. GCM10030267]|uniref:hypothetical protein n=1 Tax=Brachybacterium sp. GCM10030267 TaxID=3273381 RepID=UPI0036085D64